ncbi:MAG: hypothetical protein KDI19_12390 [Pseudomonadales bacterium]|nr:hypothetical protein [Pseudomonadales bacterium]
MSRRIVQAAVWFILLSVPAVFGADAPAPAGSDASPSGDQQGQAQAPGTEQVTGEKTGGEEPAPPPVDEHLDAKPGNLKENVTRALEVFVPSEEIDVDKPVDFPTDI